MPDELQKAPAVARWEWMALAVLAIAFALLRAPLFTAQGLLLGWNSDAALFGLMARAMRDGSDFPLFFWGQFYLGTVTSMLSVAIAAVLPGATVGPLAVRLAAALQVIVAITFYWLALRRMFGRIPAMLAAAWMVAGPSFLFFFTTAPIGAEQLFLITSIVFWYVTRVPFTRPREWMIAGFLAGFGMWLHQGVVFLLAATTVALLLERRVRARFVLYAALAAIAGYMPALLTLLRNDPLLYKRTILDWSLVHIAGNVYETLRGDLWLLFADDSITGIVTALGVLVLAFAGLRAIPRSRVKTIAVWTCLFSAAFYLFTTYPYPGAVRYIVPLVPLVYGFAAHGVTLWYRAAGARRVVALTFTVVIAGGLYAARWSEARAVARGESEQYTNWPGGFDPRPVLDRLRQGRYGVCYGEVWVAHKLEFLTDPPVRFAIVRSVHRTLLQSLALVERPGPKCFVDNFGNVRTLGREEEAMWAAAVRLRGQKARAVPPKPWWKRLF